ncbi:uncharacterized protein LOC131330706 [Rhododendron vialii]|uniref:uncharacterized protein LOC131330706 n=1 Tax=Rhododendron vialii TaxID=182163 RepID=UPI00265F7608|nr:uncharacterized protein LOC131330706 [Rhododendron vialii]
MTQVASQRSEKPKLGHLELSISCSQTGEKIHRRRGERGGGGRERRGEERRGRGRRRRPPPPDRRRFPFSLGQLTRSFLSLAEDFLSLSQSKVTRAIAMILTSGGNDRLRFL